MSECTSCLRDYGAASYAFCLECGRPLLRERDLPTIEMNMPGTDDSTLKAINLGKSPRRNIFSPKENAEFEYLLRELDVMVRVPEETGHWCVDISVLDLLLRCHCENSEWFRSFEELRGRYVSVSEVDPNASIRITWVHRAFDVMPLLQKFGLIYANRGADYSVRFTKKMNRFVYWLEYTGFAPSRPQVHSL